MLTKLTMPSGHSVRMSSDGEVRVTLDLSLHQAASMALGFSQMLIKDPGGAITIAEVLGGVTAAEEFVEGLDVVLTEASEMKQKGVAA